MLKRRRGATPVRVPAPAASATKATRARLRPRIERHIGGALDDGGSVVTAKAQVLGIG